MTEVATSTALARIAARDVPPAPALASFADDLYDALLPVAWLDGEAGWHLALYCGAIGEMFQSVADVARDTPQGPGWSAVMDLARCPDAWLPWLGQFAGVTVPPGATPAQGRAWIAGTDGFKRGTPAAIRAATQATLTGSKTVVFQERLGGNAYVLGVYTLTPETPDQAATLRAILSQKPGGIRLDYSAGAANTYQAVKVGYATYTAAKNAFSNYGHMAAGIPG
jgi:Phage tail protein (Tail_P2_I)